MKAINQSEIKLRLKAIEVAIKFRTVQYGDKTAVSGTISDVLNDGEKIFKAASNQL